LVRNGAWVEGRAFCSHPEHGVESCSVYWQLREDEMAKCGDIHQRVEFSQM